MIQDLYPTPGMDAFVDFLGDATIFPALYSNSRYWQVENEEEYCNKPSLHLVTDLSGSLECHSGGETLC